MGWSWPKRYLLYSWWRQHKSSVERPDPDAYIWGSGKSFVKDFAWHKIESYVKTGNPGTFTLWVDGVKAYTWSGDTSSAGGSWNYLLFGSNWSGAEGCCTHDATNHLHIDDVEVFSDSTAGTEASGSMADATVSTGSFIIIPPPDAGLLSDGGRDTGLADAASMADTSIAGDAQAPRDTFSEITSMSDAPLEKPSGQGGLDGSSKLDSDADSGRSGTAASGGAAGCGCDLGRSAGASWASTLAFGMALLCAIRRKRRSGRQDERRAARHVARFC